ncbi:MAG: hypothetical protein U5L01_15680 [Rheinheimera sp.]|nr:hypothetical protein [Rheinheimera sp.]
MYQLHLNDLTIEQFLAEYWQKKACGIKKAALPIFKIRLLQTSLLV